jgi:hypothetical protein
MNATVDLNPHQIEAALFAFRSPLSRGALLAEALLGDVRTTDGRHPITVRDHHTIEDRITLKCPGFDTALPVLVDPSHGRGTNVRLGAGFLHDPDSGAIAWCPIYWR